MTSSDFINDNAFISNHMTRSIWRILVQSLVQITACLTVLCYIFGFFVSFLYCKFLYLCATKGGAKIGSGDVYPHFQIVGGGGVRGNF